MGTQNYTAAPKQSQIKPKPLIVAVWMLLLSVFILGPISLILDWDHIISLGPIRQMITFQFITIAVMSWLIFKISQGRNWARIIFLILFILGALPGVLIIFDKFEYSMLLGMVSFAQVILQLMAVSLIFLGSGTYFKKK